MNLLEQFKQVKTFVFDVDGVLTDGAVIVMEDGQIARRMNIKDGYALQLAIKKEYKVLVISGGTSEGVQKRLERLGITDIYMTVKDKVAVLKEYMDRHQLSRSEILFMGDDIPDYKVMQMVGLPCAPADAVPEIKQLAKYISPVNGGFGCARDVIEKVLKQNNCWPLDTEITSK